ncbi:tumor necrosis factor receptor superfamily member 25 [Carettochelys insculpta]|uniref:tumor necrosis factor receptor superfamily member 25 n=1 Tax=Carettochelys insculpta TaxID=44489 RepID=UPI003EC0A8BA
MVSWGLEAAGGFLAMLLLMGSGFQLLGTATGSELRRAGSQAGAALGLPHHERRKRSNAQGCPAGYIWRQQQRQCCRECPAGHYMTAPCTSLGNDTACAICRPGTFNPLGNLALKCKKCSECFAQASQLVLQNCSKTRDVTCGCEAGHFRLSVNTLSQDFTCQECRRCKGQATLRNCSEEEDTQCGDCQPGFYLEGSECRECASRLAKSCGESCGSPCDGSSQGLGLEYILLGLMGPLFLGALFIYHKKTTLREDSSAAGEAAVKGLEQQQASACLSSATEQPLESQGLLHRQVTETLPVNGDACSVRPLGSQDPCRSPTVPHNAARSFPGTLPQGSKLYDIINTVPARRWKEFMRVLELPDTEIEVVELEFAHLRDQQYEMLKRWYQQKNATLEPIFSALERMELAGCAEELRQRLQRGP